MTDSKALITRLEVIAKRYALDEVQEAVAALEAKARRIAELEYMNNSILSANNELGFAFTERDEARARIAELEAALEPFIPENDMFEASMTGYWPLNVAVADLRAARAALGEKE